MKLTTDPVRIYGPLTEDSFKIAWSKLITSASIAERTIQHVYNDITEATLNINYEDEYSTRHPRYLAVRIDRMLWDIEELRRVIDELRKGE